ncbi:hypothetical protein GCM10007962_15080 [Yeosuana aromativorans]|uniref:Conjugative transposon TraM C-terminal domain-containing protein n=1 Tax=Yeosuana aromativorans TaxID=288019 RepID=A0A8J3BIH2_9FLAO|nr:conjugative transposon protein TraM [Yeosuana aromativorans]GGK21928.1 hypothetical protein GCM10007962_15080 [Yeosuana aromativorans]
MKLEKNKVVFAVLLLCVAIFIAAYTALVLGDHEEPVIDANQIPVPKLEDEQKAYDSKLDAINDLKEVRQTNAPSIYDERLLDSTGVYDPDLLEKKKQWILDSLYGHQDMGFSEGTYGNDMDGQEIADYHIEANGRNEDSVDVKLIPQEGISSKEISLEHQLFFASSPKRDQMGIRAFVDRSIPVLVDGTQTVKAHCRLRMRLMRDVVINKIDIPRNTIVYGFVSFQPNRAMIDIENINHQPVKLKAFDFEDGSEGIYIENSFRAEASKEVIDDMVQDVSIPGVPQVGGIKKIFLRNNRNTKVTILNNYQLLLKENL